MPLDPSQPLRGEDALTDLFHAGCKGAEGARLLGTESEKFGVRAETGKPVSYDGRACGILGYFAALIETGKWHPITEYEGGPVIAVEKQGDDGTVQVSLEPGAQLELSGAPVETVHGVAAELASHLADIAPIAESCGVRWMAVGYHPVASAEQLPWVPKGRYGIMREYFPEVGSRGLDMMRRTATVQVNLDYADEADACRKLRVGSKLSPIVTAIFANSPFADGRPTGGRSERAQVWLDTDNQRAGLLPAMMEPGASFRTYAEWALDIPLYLIKREGRVIPNLRQTFREYLADGWEGHEATMGDWIHHLNTLFPEVRLQRTLEMRGVDSLPAPLLPALPAIWAGLLYDGVALDEAEALVAPLQHDALQRCRSEVAELALGAEVAGLPMRELAERVVDIALGGLERRARLDAEGRDERMHLRPIEKLVGEGKCPADLLLEGVDSRRPLPPQLIELCRV